MTNHDDAFVALNFRDDRRPANSVVTRAWEGFAIERVVMTGSREFAYSWSGKSHYLALHDLKLTDGEISVDEQRQGRRLDLRDRMTFVPQGCNVSGWSALEARTNSFVTISFDTDVLSRELERTQSPITYHPAVYFSEDALRSTMEKLQASLSAGEFLGSAYVETLALLAALEVNRLSFNQGVQPASTSGKLSIRQEKSVREYIAENLDGPLSLSSVSSIAGLTRFHFIRAFSRTIGSTPHAYILQMRIDRAKILLSGTNLAISAVGAQVGFKTPNHFSSAFRSAVGCTPSQYRRSVAGN